MLPWLSRDGRRLLAARVVRSFAYGVIAVALGPYLKGLGYGGLEVGLGGAVRRAPGVRGPVPRAGGDPVRVAVGVVRGPWARRVRDLCDDFARPRSGQARAAPSPLARLASEGVPTRRAVRDGLLWRRGCPAGVRVLSVRGRVPRGPPPPRRPLLPGPRPPIPRVPCPRPTCPPHPPP